MMIDSNHYRDTLIVSLRVRRIMAQLSFIMHGLIATKRSKTS